MKISMLVGLKNNLDYSKHFYRTTRELYPNEEICFVSYGSTDGTHEWLDEISKTDDNVKIFYSDENLTFSDTFNKATEIATKDYVVYLHNDIVLYKNFLENLETLVDETTVVSYTTIEPPLFSEHVRVGKILKDFGIEIETFDKDAFNKYCTMYLEQTESKIDSGCSFFLCVNRAILLNLGGLDNIFSPMFCEDDDLILRFSLYGMKQITTNQSLCYHFVSKTSRFSDEFRERTQIIDSNSNRTFVRKWGFRKSIFNKKFNICIQFINCKYQFLYFFEPYATFIKGVGDKLKTNYVFNEQPNTKYDLQSKFVSDDTLCDITVSIDCENFSNDDVKFVQSIQDILYKNYESNGNSLSHVDMKVGNVSVRTTNPKPKLNEEMIYL